MFLAARLRWMIVPAFTLLCGACIWIFRGVEITEVRGAGQPVVIESPVKAHLTDGSTVVYPSGVTVADNTLRGAGSRYDLTAQFFGAVTLVHLDSVIGMESFRTVVNGPASVVVTTIATPVGIVAGAALAVAIFGSCPTIYADTGSGAALEAESFSYSIAPLFEVRDVDRLALAADPAGVVRLDVRNEAMETHYLNHLELLEVRHLQSELALPDERGVPVVVDGRPTLVGVAYAKLVSSDEVPDELPVDAGAWHFHSGSVDDDPRPRKRCRSRPEGAVFSKP